MNRLALEHAVNFIKSWLQLRYEREELPGYVVAIAHKGTILMNEAYGYANLEQSIKMTPDHVFRIASHSKTFTATALMLLAEEGALRIDDYVADYLPWLKDHKDSRWPTVTIRQLMSHGAGVIRDGLDQNYWQLHRPFPDTDRLVMEISETGLVIDNNVKMKYSNYGYSVLGLLIEAVSGQSYNDFVTERIIRPLGLTNTHPDYQPGVGPLVTGYSRRDNKTRLPIADINTHAMAAATGFCSTAADLCTYFTAHMRGSDNLLSEESKKEMQRVQWQAMVPGSTSEAGYGLGMIREKIGERQVIGHSGGFPGCITKSMADPEDELVVVALTNCIDGPAGLIVTGIYKIISYFQENTPAVKSERDLTHLEGFYMNLWNTLSITATGDKLVAAHPDTWEPFAAVETVTHMDDRTLKVAEAGSFSSEGESVQFDVIDGEVARLNYAGAALWPNSVWLRMQEQRTMVGE